MMKWDAKQIWFDQLPEKNGVTWLNAESYDKHVASAKKGDKPWLLMFMYTPHGSNEKTY